jgi:3',5'-cyclic AMP phosphodiesterase CpdA
MRFLLAHLSDVHIGPLPLPLGRAWLASLGDPRDVSFVPGNHDAYVRGSMPHLARTFVPWVGDATGHEARFPYLRVRGEVALIGLSSGNPSGPFLATGRLGNRQLAAFGQMLEETGRRGLVRVVMIHHPPHRSGATLGRHLHDAARFKDIIRHYGAELVIHGHNHRSSVAHLSGPRGRVPVVGVPSGSAVPGSRSHRAAYHLFTIERDHARLAITARARGLVADSLDIGDLGPVPL